MPVNGALPITRAVSGPSGDPVPTGPVVISGSNGLDSLVNGSVSLTAYYPWQPGPNTVTVTYLGDSTYASASASGTFTKMGYGNVTVSPQNPALYVGNALTLSISVSQAANLPQPTGTVTASYGSYTSAATALSSGSASITIPANSLPVGNDGVTIAYSGDLYYVPSSNTDVIYVTSTPPGFTISSINLSFAAGATTGNASTIWVTPSGGFTGAVTLTASITAGPFGARDAPTLSFGTTSPVNISGTNAGSATMTVSTTGTATSGCGASLESTPRAPWLAGGGAALAVVLLFGIPARRRRWRRMLGVMALRMALAGGITACGGGGSTPCTPTSVAGTTTGTYTATVTATAGTITKTMTVTITVN
ncbi:MAG TPA: Ig-like domain repeat protein [Terracidiphilus sp.]|nr:Ig-like domain repeat protein [Terracidiphilus sp.]